LNALEKTLGAGEKLENFETHFHIRKWVSWSSSFSPAPKVFSWAFNFSNEPNFLQIRQLELSIKSQELSIKSQELSIQREEMAIKTEEDHGSRESACAEKEFAMANYYIAKTKEVGCSCQKSSTPDPEDSILNTN
jgi:hypothetical protein